MASEARAISAPKERSGPNVRDIAAVLQEHLSPVTCRTIVDSAFRQTGHDSEVSQPEDSAGFLREIKRGVRLFARNEKVAGSCIAALDRLLRKPIAARIELRGEADILAARNATRALGLAVGFVEPAQTKVLTALAELARNALQYAGGGEVRIEPLAEPARGIQIVVEDTGPGIPNLADILSGRFRSRNGMGVGLRGAKALSDDLQIDTAQGKGTKITFRKYLPR